MIENIFWFLYSWVIVFWIRSNIVNSAKLMAERIAVAEIKMMVEKDVESVKNHIAISDFFDDAKFIFSPYFFDKWTPKQFIRFAIEKRIEAGKDIIFKNADKYYNVL